MTDKRIKEWNVVMYVPQFMIALRDLEIISLNVFFSFIYFSHDGISHSSQSIRSSHSR